MAHHLFGDGRRETLLLGRRRKGAPEATPAHLAALRTGFELISCGVCTFDQPRRRRYVLIVEEEIPMKQSGPNIASTSTRVDRRTVDLSSYPDLVVICPGMSVNRITGIKMLLES